MAWVKKTVNGVLYAQEVVTLAASATYAYTSEIDFLKPNSELNNYVTVMCEASAVTGTNVDVELFGCHTSAGTKFSLLDAPCADVTNAAKTKAGVVDLNAYPAPYYYVGLLCDTNESANTMTVTIVHAG